MAQIKNKILFPDLNRNPEDEFPKQRVPDYVISEVEKLIQLHGDLELFIDWKTRSSVTASQLIDDAYKIASQFKRRACQPGAVISCLIYSDVNYFSFLLATWMSGCVSSSLQHSFSQELLIQLIRSSHSRLLLCDMESAERCRAIKIECPELEEVFVLGQFEGCTPFDRLLSDEAFDRDEFKRPEPYDPDETLSMVFSSGTTGEPKGILLTQQNIYSYLLTARPKANRPGMRTLFVPRIGNVMGLVFGLRDVLIYSKTYLMSTYRDEWLFAAIEETKPERALLYLPHILAIAKHPKSETSNLSSIEAVFTAGMSISKDLQKKLFLKLTSLKTFFMFYGMTEFAIGTMRPFYDYEENDHRLEELRKNHKLKPDSVGHLCPMNLMKVVDENTGETLGPNQKGELCFKGPSLFKGYWNNAEATTDIVRDGWIHTGDVGYYDDDGDVFYVQRNKELIKYLGHHVIPSQLEAILKSHPAVEDAAVVGIKSEDYGELPMAYAIKKPGHDKLEARRLVNFLHDRVHDESLLRGGLVFIDEIPRNVMGKIVRQQLRDRAESEAWKPSSFR
ncbi:luciferin 4-monooxygenase-like [Daphnia carinata]|uniref:luciferin 4-monooxygenase-like n=1 Tax=Daphnia carinata TaxID=120202 RepID=UPI00257F6B98|nr:luciferin 4-monooxygenase-like [Daphnia carinata]